MDAERHAEQAVEFVRKHIRFEYVSWPDDVDEWGPIGAWLPSRIGMMEPARDVIFGCGFEQLITQLASANWVTSDASDWILKVREEAMLPMRAVTQICVRTPYVYGRLCPAQWWDDGSREFKLFQSASLLRPEHAGVFCEGGA